MRNPFFGVLCSGVHCVGVPCCGVHYFLVKCCNVHCCRVHLSGCIFAVSIVERSIAAEIIVRYSRFHCCGFFVAEYFDVGFFVAEFIVAGSSVAKFIVAEPFVHGQI